MEFYNIGYNFLISLTIYFFSYLKQLNWYKFKIIIDVNARYNCLNISCSYKMVNSKTLFASTPVIVVRITTFTASLDPNETISSSNIIR